MFENVTAPCDFEAIFDWNNEWQYRTGLIPSGLFNNTNPTSMANAIPTIPSVDYNGLLINLSDNMTVESIAFGAHSSIATTTEASGARDYLITGLSWTVTDGG